MIRSRLIVMGALSFSLWTLFTLGQSLLEKSFLRPLPLAILNPHLTQEDLQAAQRAGFARQDTPSPGSGLVALGRGRYLALTDRGPNGKCPGGASFPVPRFTPSIVFLQEEGGSLKVEKSLPLKDVQGRPISGLPNQKERDDVPHGDAACKTLLPYDPGGIDPEDIALLPDGRFLLVEEYSPSLLVVDRDGKVLVRYVPEGLRLEGAPYPVQEILPRVLLERRKNRGFENLALSKDGKSAWAVLQSPLGSTKDDGLSNSLVARAVRFDLSDPLKARVTGMYLVPFSDPASYPKKNKPKDMKYSAAQWLRGEEILLLERADGGVKVFLVDFSRATNLLGRPDANSLDLDRAGVDYRSLGIVPAERRPVLDLNTQVLGITDKMEGLALLSSRELVLINDNDFGINNEGPSGLFHFELSEELR